MPSMNRLRIICRLQCRTVHAVSGHWTCLSFTRTFASRF